MATHMIRSSPCIDFFLVALIRAYSTWENKSQLFSPQIQNSFQNPPQILPKPSQNPPQTHLQKQTCPKRTPKSIFGASWTIFGDFWEGPGTPLASKIPQKSITSRLLKNTIFQIRFFMDFGAFWPPKNLPKSIEKPKKSYPKANF